MTLDEEARLIAEVRAHIGDEDYWDFEHPVRPHPLPDIIAVEARLSPDALVDLNLLSASSGTPVEDLIAMAVEGYLDNERRKHPSLFADPG